MRIKILEITLLGIVMIALITLILDYQATQDYFFNLGCRSVDIINLVIKNR
jgi:hypothetical protein